MSVSEVAIPCQLTKARYRLQKAPARHWARHYGEGYMVTGDRNVAVSGATAAMSAPAMAQEKAER